MLFKVHPLGNDTNQKGMETDGDYGTCEHCLYCWYHVMPICMLDLILSPPF